MFGEGAEMTAMVAMKRRRIRERERYEQGQYQEGSKAKATADEDKERLKFFPCRVQLRLEIQLPFAVR